MSDPLATAAAFIADREGFSETPYRDDGRGVWTIAFGFTYLPNGVPVTASTPAMMRDEAEPILSAMVARVLASVRQMVCVPVSDNALAAMTSFAYNEGTHALRTSTLMDRLNAGKTAEAADCFRAWVYAGGERNEGLANRREAERTLFLTPDAPAAPADTADALDMLYNPELEL